MIVVDTNVVSELMRPAPDPAVAAWLSGCDPTMLFLTAITMAEILYGLERMPAGRRRNRLQTAAAEIFATFPEHVLPFDAAAAARYAQVVSDRERAGRPISALDAQLAAICLAHGAQLATRNIADFERTSVPVTNPFSKA